MLGNDRPNQSVDRHLAPQYVTAGQVPRNVRPRSVATLSSAQTRSPLVTHRGPVVANSLCSATTGRTKASYIVRLSHTSGPARHLALFGQGLLPGSFPCPDSIPQRDTSSPVVANSMCSATTGRTKASYIVRLSHTSAPARQLALFGRGLLLGSFPYPDSIPRRDTSSPVVANSMCSATTGRTKAFYVVRLSHTSALARHLALFGLLLPTPLCAGRAVVQNVPKESVWQAKRLW